MSIQEAWVVVADVNRRGGIRSHDSPHNEVRLCEHCADLRNLALVAHVDACCLSAGLLHDAVKCGDGWYCDKAQEIERLGKGEERDA